MHIFPRRSLVSAEDCLNGSYIDTDINGEIISGLIIEETESHHLLMLVLKADEESLLYQVIPIQNKQLVQSYSAKVEVEPQGDPVLISRHHKQEGLLLVTVDGNLIVALELDRGTKELSALNLDDFELDDLKIGTRRGFAYSSWKISLVVDGGLEKYELASKS